MTFACFTYWLSIVFIAICLPEYTKCTKLEMLFIILFSVLAGGLLAQPS